MAAPVGNEFWKQRSSHGRKPIFESPEQLWDACVEYFQWVEDNPLQEAKVVTVKGEAQVIALPKMRAMTIDGLCIFLDIDDSTWANYREREAFIGIIARVEKIIRQQKFTGAAADLLNANIIARDLGMSDKRDVKVSHTLEDLLAEDDDE